LRAVGANLKSTVLELESFGYVAFAAHALGGAFRPLNFGFWDDAYEAENGDAVTIVAVATQAKVRAFLRCKGPEPSTGPSRSSRRR
jgi:hypothetical protein